MRESFFRAKQCADKKCSTSPSREKELIGAGIKIEGTTAAGVTDLNGNVVFKNTPSGTFFISVFYSGYRSKKTVFTFTADTAKVSLVILLAPDEKSTG